MLSVKRDLEHTKNPSATKIEATRAESETLLWHTSREQWSSPRAPGRATPRCGRRGGRGKHVGNVEAAWAFGADLEHHRDPKITKALRIEVMRLNARRSPGDAFASAIIGGQRSVGRSLFNSSSGTDWVFKRYSMRKLALSSGNVSPAAFASGSPARAAACSMMALTSPPMRIVTPVR